VVVARRKVMEPDVEWSVREKLAIASYVLHSGSQHWYVLFYSALLCAITKCQTTCALLTIFDLQIQC